MAIESNSKSQLIKEMLLVELDKKAICGRDYTVGGLDSPDNHLICLCGQKKLENPEICPKSEHRFTLDWNCFKTRKKINGFKCIVMWE
jgi:hypothetical protein